MNFFIFYKYNEIEKLFISIFLTYLKILNNNNNHNFGMSDLLALLKVKIHKYQ